MKASLPREIIAGHKIVLEDAVLEGKVTGEAAGAASRTGSDAASLRHAILDTILDIRADWLCSSWRTRQSPFRLP